MEMSGTFVRGNSRRARERAGGIVARVVFRFGGDAQGGLRASNRINALCHRGERPRAALSGREGSHYRAQLPTITLIVVARATSLRDPRHAA